MSELQQELCKDKFERKNKFLFLWILIGPGFLAAIGDNDAGGLISYCITGMKFGMSFFIPFTIFLVLITYTVQEMSMRLSVVTQTGFTSLIRKHYGKHWMKYNVAAIFIENIMMLVTEFIGMSAGLAFVGIPMWIGVLVSMLLVIFIITISRYSTKERLSVAIGFSNIVFVILAFISGPHVGSAVEIFDKLKYVSSDSNVFWYIVAMVGNSVAPWMIFFQSSACLDKKIKKNNIKMGRIDTAVGCFVQVVIAVCVIVSGAALFGKVGGVSNLGPSSIIEAFFKFTGKFSGILFGVGIFNAGLLASITISLSTTWCVSEASGWKMGLDLKICDAPGFYLIYIGSVVLAAAISIIPGIPLNYITMLTQVVGGLIMVPVLLFLIMLTNKKEIMGEYVNSRSQNARARVVALILVTMIGLFIFNSIAG